MCVRTSRVSMDRVEARNNVSNPAFQCFPDSMYRLMGSRPLQSGKFAASGKESTMRPTVLAVLSTDSCENFPKNIETMYFLNEWKRVSHVITQTLI
mmetsp:Transcript_6408/g.8237  ORF Transcript_6408/g.8237 Transcript_6408/m.8237 type:complete len:96 (-) Transcript_6408:1057-1344(-)